MQPEEHRENGFKAVWREAKRRSRGPVTQVAAWGNLVIGIMIFGGIPIWIELANYVGGSEPTIGPLRSALGTFFPALIGTTFLAIVTEERDKRLRIAGVAYGLFFCFVAVLVLRRSLLVDGWAIAVATASCFAAMWLWWMANADSPAFMDKPDPQDSLGGPPEREPIGSLSGIRH